MRACARTVGSPEGPMREQSDHETWNSARSLPYGEFMASMFLRYVIFADSENSIASTADADGLDEGMQNVVDKDQARKVARAGRGVLALTRHRSPMLSRRCFTALTMPRIRAVSSVMPPPL